MGGREQELRVSGNRGLPIGEKEKNGRGKEESRERAEEWRCWVHVWARGCWSIPGSAFPDRLNGKGQRASFPMKEGLSASSVCRLDVFGTHSRTHVQTDRVPCTQFHTWSLKGLLEWVMLYITTIWHQNCSQGPNLNKARPATDLWGEGRTFM